MANTTKVTQRDFYNAIIALAKGEPCSFTPDEIVDFAEGRIAMLDKKSANRKPSKTAEANAELATVIEGVLTSEGATVSEIMAKDATLAGLSNQKVSVVLRLMVADGKVVKTTDKKKSLFALA